MNLPSARAWVDGIAQAHGHAEAATKARSLVVAPTSAPVTDAIILFAAPCPERPGMPAVCCRFGHLGAACMRRRLSSSRLSIRRMMIPTNDVRAIGRGIPPGEKICQAIRSCLNALLISQTSARGRPGGDQTPSASLHWDGAHAPGLAQAMGSLGKCSRRWACRCPRCGSVSKRLLHPPAAPHKKVHPRGRLRHGRRSVGVGTPRSAAARRRGHWH